VWQPKEEWRDGIRSRAAGRLEQSAAKDEPTQAAVRVSRSKEGVKQRRSPRLGVPFHSPQYSQTLVSVSPRPPEELPSLVPKPIPVKAGTFLSDFTLEGCDFTTGERAFCARHSHCQELRVVEEVRQHNGQQAERDAQTDPWEIVHKRGKGECTRPEAWNG
jgi:hypothetical protein